MMYDRDMFLSSFGLLFIYALVGPFCLRARSFAPFPAYSAQIESVLGQRGRIPHHPRHVVEHLTPLGRGVLSSCKGRLPAVLHQISRRKLYVHSVLMTPTFPATCSCNEEAPTLYQDFSIAFTMGVGHFAPLQRK